MADHVFAESVAGYALGALDPAERREFEAHLPTCAECQAQLREMRRVAHAIDLGVPAVVAPASLKARTMAHATAQPQEPPGVAPAPLRGTATGARSTTGVLDRPRPKGPLPSWVRLALAASAVLFVLSAAYAALLHLQVGSLRQAVTDASNEADRLRDELLARRDDIARLVLTTNVLSAPDVQRVALSGQDAAPAASGFAYWSRTHGIVFNAQQLPALDPSRVYQLWVVSAGQVHSAGIFRVGSTGAGTLSAPLPANVSIVEAVAVSLEPDPGVPVRTGPVVLMGKSD